MLSAGSGRVGRRSDALDGSTSLGASRSTSAGSVVVVPADQVLPLGILWSTNSASSICRLERRAHVGFLPGRNRRPRPADASRPVSLRSIHQFSGHPHGRRARRRWRAPQRQLQQGIDLRGVMDLNGTPDVVAEFLVHLLPVLVRQDDAGPARSGAPPAPSP